MVADIFVRNGMCLRPTVGLLWSLQQICVVVFKVFKALAILGISTTRTKLCRTRICQELVVDSNTSPFASLSHPSFSSEKLLFQHKMRLDKLRKLL